MRLVISLIIAWATIITWIPETHLGMALHITYFSINQLLLFIPAIVTTLLAYHHVAIKTLKQQVNDLTQIVINNKK